jgi:hypothetical protein
VCLQGVVVVADVRVREDEDALGEGDLPLERDALGQIEQALVSEEAVFADVQPGEPAKRAALRKPSSANAFIGPRAAVRRGSAGAA